MKMKIGKEGSALLIVLGFLSFMMVSAVSFAVYMRIERQASSNYRHTLSARHYLEAGLFQAMEEVDSELRVVNNGRSAGLKFPLWMDAKGGRSVRVLPSGVENKEKNSNNARVLSVEALGCLPAQFVNDARYYSVPDASGDDDENDASDNNCFGAKWRPFTLPVSRLDGNGNARNTAEIGRYAYLCMNVSDLLDVNTCLAPLEQANSCSNRISINHLFNTEGDAAKFHQNLLRDRYYENLADFYACMYENDDPTFGSPYHEMVEDGNDNAFNSNDVVPNDPKNARHILITDSIVKAEPRSRNACNLKPVRFQGSFEDGGDLKARWGTRSFSQVFTRAENMLESMRKAVDGWNDNMERTTVGLIADYLDRDGVPQLNIPSAERAPMICRLVLRDEFLNWGPKIETREEGKGKDKRKIYSLTFPKISEIMGVETIFPFKGNNTSKDYEVNIDANLYISGAEGGNRFDFRDDFRPDDKIWTAYLEGNTAGKNARDEYCFHFCKTKMSKIPRIDVAQEDADGGNRKMLVPNLYISMTVLVSLKGGESGKIVDAVPFAFPDWSMRNEMKQILGLQQRNRLFFKADGLNCQTLIQNSIGKDIKLAWPWQALEVPDARFNYRASNWYRSGATAAQPREGGAWRTQLAEILGKDGRDGDIYMATSDLGSFQSPGEFGFIVRPFVEVDAPGTDDPLADPVESITATKQFAHMFRTIRLYDHGSQKADKIYKYFTYANDDGSLDGPRVNPLSSEDNVLRAALSAVPVDYRWALDREEMKNHLFYTKSGKGDPDYALSSRNDWERFSNGWLEGVKRCQAQDNRKINAFFQYNISDVYGMDETMGWYSRSGNGINAALANPTQLSEVERKMLFSYTLDNFSDRQQLFLFVIAAEATIPTFGATTDVAVKSLAGGKAVALVWRDPYPRGYDKENDTWEGKGSRKWYQADGGANYNRKSPWVQYNNAGNETRYDGYHDMRVLFYKQISN